jgi:hypothetical protein
MQNDVITQCPYCISYGVACSKGPGPFSSLQVIKHAAYETAEGFLTYERTPSLQVVADTFKQEFPNQPAPQQNLEDVRHRIVDEVDVLRNTLLLPWLHTSNCPVNFRCCKK